MIRKGDHPESDPAENKLLNKFIGKNKQGYRGELIAITPDRKQGIIFLNNNFIIVKEGDPNHYPKEIKIFHKAEKTRADFW